MVDTQNLSELMGKTVTDEDGREHEVVAILSWNDERWVVVAADEAFMTPRLSGWTVADFNDQFSEMIEHQVVVEVTYVIKETWTVEAPRDADGGQLSAAVEESRDNGNEPDNQDWERAVVQRLTFIRSSH